MNGHTPGPWVAVRMNEIEWRIDAPHDASAPTGLAIVYAPDGEDGDVVGQADARLIAAAPMLLEALKQAVTSMQDSGYPNSHIAVREARAAIAAATGDSHE